jgi:hypothetical protein
MSRAHRFPIASLFLIAAVPLAWLACGGGESKPAESPASESSGSASSDAPADSETPSPAASASSASSAAAADTSAPSPSSDAPAATTPPPPTFGSTDCGKCVDKTCAKQEAACGKNSDCQSTLDSIHGCSGSAASCFDGATAPSSAKPKKLAAAYETCAKKAVASKACKTKCQ